MKLKANNHMLGPVKGDPGRELIDRHQAFVYHYVQSGGNVEYSVRQAGFDCLTKESCERTANRLLHDAAVMQAIRAEQMKSLNGELATMALGTLREILGDKEVHPKVRLEAARITLDKAQIEEAIYSQNQTLDTMTISDLRRLASDTSRALAELRSIGPVIDADDTPKEESDPQN